MVKIMENPIKIDDLGVPLFFETTIYFAQVLFFHSQNSLNHKSEIPKT